MNTAKVDFEQQHLNKNYKVVKAKSPVKVDGDWNNAAWKDIEPLDIKNHIFSEPEHKPKTQAKIIYDNRSIHVIFRVKDKYIRAVAKKYHDKVCNDSCVEFFFSPSSNLSLGYFNMEINCGGVILFKYRLAKNDDFIFISESDCDKIYIFHSEPKIVEPEKQTPTTWTLQCRIPFEVLENYCSIQKPAPGISWRANFYKCGDNTSHPHWLTWSKIDLPNPTFHEPDFFGSLQFK